MSLPVDGVAYAYWAMMASSPVVAGKTSPARGAKSNRRLTNMKNSLLMSIAMLALIAISLPSPAAAKDAVTASVSNYGDAIVMNNGNPLAKGTFAVGTIQLFYTFEGDQFQAGNFASFDLNLGIKASPITGQQTQYPVQFLSLDQIGSQNILLTPASSSFNVTSAGWGTTTTVTISIAPTVPSDPALNCDGCELVANMRMTTPGGSKLDTPTNVQVHIKLVHPAACLRVYDFLTDQGLTTIVTSTIVNVGGPKANPKIVGTNPFGQFSDNILIVNTCSSEQSFDLDIVLDSHFETNPHNGHGNAVFTYLTSGAVDPNNFDITTFGGGTGQKQNLWLSNITLPGNSSFLATVHIDLITGGSPSTFLPSNGCFDGFSAQLLLPNSNPLLFAPAILNSMAVPNPASAQMTFTVQ
jgi:hypothetical protein